MKNEWKEYALKDILTISYGKSLPKQDRTPGDYNVYGSGGVIDTNKTYLIEGPGIIIGRKGTVGSIYYEKGNFYPIDTTYYIEKSEEYDIKFIYYMLKEAKLNNMNSHTAVPGLNREDLYRLRFRIPEKAEQQKIASVLSAFDEKIELNNEMNEILEKIARSIFMHWFIDFEFPNESGEPYKSSGGELVDSELGLIPKGWKVGILGEIIDITSGKRPLSKSNKKDMEYKIPLVGASSIMGFVKEVLYNEPVIIIGRVGTLGVVQRYIKPIWASDNTLVIRSSFYEYIYQLLKLLDYSTLNRGSTQPLLTQNDIKNLPIIIPTEDILYRFEKLGSSIYRKVQCNIEENNTLSQIRDTLIPKLISGEIRVM